MTGVGHRLLLLVIPFLVLLAAGSVEARIGETSAECDERYGELVEEMEASVPGGVGKARIYHKNDFVITVEFQKGKVWWIQYSKNSLKDEQRLFIFKINSEQVSWRGPFTFLKRNHWKTSNGKLHAVVVKNKNLTVIEIMTQECVVAFGRDYERKLKLVGKRRVTGKGEPKKEAGKPVSGVLGL